MEEKSKVFGKRVIERRSQRMLNQVRRIVHSEVLPVIQLAAIIGLLSRDQRA